MKFTVVITVWRREQLLPHAIQSVMSRTWPASEILVYSDGRSRTTERVVEQLQHDHPIHYRRMPRRPRLRGNHLRRAGLEQGTGSHVCIVGHDCILYPTYLESHAGLIAGDPDAVSVVRVAYWKELTRRRSRPTRDDLVNAGEGEIDLLCIAFPRQLSLRAGCFGPEMERLRHADFLSFAALRELATPVLLPSPEQAAHF